MTETSAAKQAKTSVLTISSIERIGLPDAVFAAKGLNKTDNFTSSLSALNHTCEEPMIALLERGPPYRSCLNPRNMRVSAGAGRGEIDFLNTLSAVRKLYTKTKPKERKDNYYVSQSQNTKRLQIGQPRRGNREGQRILL